VQVLEHQQQPGRPGQPSQQLQHGLAAHREHLLNAERLGKEERREPRPCDQHQPAAAHDGLRDPGDHSGLGITGPQS